MCHAYFVNTPKNVLKGADLFALLVGAPHFMNIPYKLVAPSKASSTPAFGEVY
jgi:hypothetical protein